MHPKGTSYGRRRAGGGEIDYHSWRQVLDFFFVTLDNRQVNCARFAHSDEKIDGASAALSLCGIALDFIETAGRGIRAVAAEYKKDGE